MWFWWSALMVTAIGVVACAPLTSEAKPPAQPAEPAEASERHPAAPSPLHDVALQKHFDAEGVTGTVALFDSRENTTVCSDLDRCTRGYLPASTFKIPHALIALETQVLSSADSPLPWDGQQYPVAAWNRDHTLASAVEVSCVPCFQQVAKRIGEPRMREWLTKLGYGNGDPSGGIEGRFWLEEGNLRVTPLQQIDFLVQLNRGELPVSQHARETTIAIIPTTVGEGYQLRAKTGSASTPETGWFVGWLETEERSLYFAVVLDGHEPNVELRPARRSVTLRILREKTGLALN